MWHLFLVSALTFIMLNVVENIMHYSIGRNGSVTRSWKTLELVLPDEADWKRIIVIMLIFALLQSTIVCLSENC